MRLSKSTRCTAPESHLQLSTFSSTRDRTFRPSTTMSKKKPPHIVVVGSGWAGLYIAQYINYDVYSVTVISPRRTSAYTPLLASAACGLFPFSCAEEPIRTSGRSCNFVQAHALDVDFERHKIHCQAAIEDEDMLNDKKFNISYDKLILCPGCEKQFHHIL